MQARGCATLWLITLCHVAFQKYYTNLCQYEHTAFSKALSGFGFAIRSYFYQLTGTAWCCAFKFLWLPGRPNPFSKIFFFYLCGLLCEQHVLIFSTMTAVETILPLDLVPFPRDSGCSFLSSIVFITNDFLPKSLWPRKFGSANTGPPHQFSQVPGALFTAGCTQ